MRNPEIDETYHAIGIEATMGGIVPEEAWDRKGEIIGNQDHHERLCPVEESGAEVESKQACPLSLTQ